MKWQLCGDKIKDTGEQCDDGKSRSKKCTRNANLHRDANSQRLSRAQLLAIIWDRIAMPKIWKNVRLYVKRSPGACRLTSIKMIQEVTPAAWETARLDTAAVMTMMATMYVYSDCITD